MTWGRTFWKVTRYARAARFWLLLAFAALAMCGVREARAQEGFQCLTQYNDCTEPTVAQAHASIMAVIADRNIEAQNPNPQPSECTVGGSPAFCVAIRTGFGWTNIVRRYGEGCPAGQEWFGGNLNRCDTTCESRPSSTTLFYPKPGSMACVRGCMRSYYANGDGETMTEQSTGQKCETTLEDACAAIPPEQGNFVRNPLLGVCEPVSPECPAGMKPVNGKCEVNDFCPVGQILNEQNMCVPREGECPAGTSRSLEGMCVSQDDDGDPNKCPAGQTTGSDGTCKPDADNDGQPDEDSDTGTFSGGDSCKVPPMCSGDSIMCGQARIQWRIDCNTRRNQKISGGACSPATMPVCVGESCDLMQYAQLMQAWHTRCAVEKMAEGGGNDGDGNNRDEDFDGAGEGAAAANALSDDGVTADDAFTDESENNDGAGGLPGGTGELDDSGLGFSRSCPNLPSIEVFGSTLDFNAAAGNVLCDWVQLGGQFVLIISALVSVRILMSGGAG